MQVHSLLSTILIFIFTSLASLERRLFDCAFIISLWQSWHLSQFRILFCVLCHCPPCQPKNGKKHACITCSAIQQRIMHMIFMTRTSCMFYFLCTFCGIMSRLDIFPHVAVFITCCSWAVVIQVCIVNNTSPYFSGSTSLSFWAKWSGHNCFLVHTCFTHCCYFIFVFHPLLHCYIFYSHYCWLYSMFKFCVSCLSAHKVCILVTCSQAFYALGSVLKLELISFPPEEMLVAFIPFLSAFVVA